MNEVKHLDIGAIDNCKNLAESYGEICVKCNKCGRFDEEKQIKSTDWLTRGLSKEQLKREKQEAVMSADLEMCMSFNIWAERETDEKTVDYDYVAEKMFAKGYRKWRNVINEFAEKLIKNFNDLEYSANTPRKTVEVDELRAQMDWILHDVAIKTIKEAVKEYAESENGNL